MKGCLGEIVEVMIDNDGRYSVGILELPPLEYTHYIHSVTDIFLIIWCIYNVWYELKVISIFLNQNNLLRSIYVCFFYIIFHFKRILIGFHFVLWARRLEIHQIIERLSNLVCQATWLNQGCKQYSEVVGRDRIYQYQFQDVFWYNQHKKNTN